MSSFIPSILSVTALGCIAAGAIAQTTSSPTAPEPKFEVSGTFDYSRGDYGLSEDTTIFSHSANIAYQYDAWIFRASVPWVKIKGPADVVVTGGGSGNGNGGGSSGGGGGASGGSGVSGLLGALTGRGSSSSSSSSSGSSSSSSSTTLRRTSRSESGIGDPVISATNKLGPILAGFDFDITAKAKLPVGDEEKGLSTGKADFYAQADVYRVIDVWIPFASVGYRFMGGSLYKDGPYASVGGAYIITDDTRAGLSADWSSRLVSGGDDTFQVGAFVSHKFAPSWTLVGSVFKGMTDATADFGAGASVAYRF